VRGSATIHARVARHVAHREYPSTAAAPRHDRLRPLVARAAAAFRRSLQRVSDRGREEPIHPRTGSWLALAGAVLAVARISVAVNIGDAPATVPLGSRFGRGTGPATDPDPPPPPTEPTSRL
jgi:hypothetical protein